MSPPPPLSGPETVARIEIDAALEAACWVVQNRDEINLSVAQGVAVREFKKFTNLLDPRAAQPVRHSCASTGDAGRVALGTDPRCLGKGQRCVHRRRRHEAIVASRSPASDARARSRRALSEPDPGDREPRGIDAPGQASGAAPDGDRLWQDADLGRRDLPADQVRRRPPRAVPGRPKQPRRAGGEGVPELRDAGRPPQVHRAVQRPAPDLEDSASLPEPHIFAQEIADDLRSALGQIEDILGDLEARAAKVPRQSAP